MSRLLVLRALSDLPLDIKKLIFTRLKYPTLIQLVSRLKQQSPSKSAFLHLDVAIIGFVWSGTPSTILARLTGPQRSWVLGRCKLLGLDHQEIRTIGGKGLILFRNLSWTFNDYQEVCQLIWCKTRWRYRCSSCDLATNLDSKQIFIRLPLCPMCQKVDRPICAFAHCSSILWPSFTRLLLPKCIEV